MTTKTAKARGKPKQLLDALSKVQGKIGLARGLHANDRDPAGFECAQNLLEEAFNICVEARGLYDPS